ncbi:MAG: hypothetical protein UY85_C0072G0002 [Candidatus Peribacteria bacterium GW2011_GWB1_54_5]|nr:MAG: hypothetical protein UY85_C0072G0002 [Candidatus Peribacteria bacterium GW2011_GWB1_54_5]
MEITPILLMMATEVLRKGIYEHYKGERYRVLGVAKHSETLEELVVYVPLYKNETSMFWVRPLSMFREEVEVDGVRRQRFAYVGK